ncbi:MAG: NAD-dependent epimerase/dehydratase family protein [Halioglobus sp.]|nr:NAD-dependent epimerase/dehydratase family protein [Halioglobus sp.]
MKLTRRQLAQYSLVGLAGIATLPSLAGESPAPRSGLNILILGGTGFLGPHLVQAALEKGHNLTLFNRGKSGPNLFPDLETLKGDRAGKLEVLQGRKWDVVIDTSAFFAVHVKNSAELLAPNADHYIFVSSVAVYKDLSKPDVDENSPVYRMDDEEFSSYSPFQAYGASKHACEMAAEAAFPGKTTSIRSDTIVGPGDHAHFRYPYWTRRATQGGEILAPGKPSDPVQYIDVRDLAQWIIYCAENSVYGTYTATSVPGYNMELMIEDCQVAADTASSLVWVDSAFLRAQEVVDIPFWVPSRENASGAGLLSVEKARQHGLRERPKLQTAIDVLEWYLELPPKKQNFVVGISPEREAQLLQAWNSRQS